MKTYLILLGLVAYVESVNYRPRVQLMAQKEVEKPHIPTEDELGATETMLSLSQAENQLNLTMDAPRKVDDSE